MTDLAIDVVLRTCNRRALLTEAVASFFAADRSGVTARLLIVDNGSTDGTADELARLAHRHGPDLVTLFEPRPGGQHALNCAIARARAPVVAFFDDDERIAPGWLQAIRREFADPETDYIAGPVLPAGELAWPEWLPSGYGGVLGIIDHGPDPRRFGPGFSAMLTQGNCALRRDLLVEAGPYPDDLPTAEDRWLNQWLQDHGKTGRYCPDLLVRHVMQPERITPAYFRQWARREGRDLAVCDRLARNPSLFRRPWYWRQLARSVVRCVLPGLAPAERFRAELDCRVALAYAETALTPRS